MKTFKMISTAFLLLAASLGTAWADRGHVHFGVTVGPYWGPAYYQPYPHYYQPYYQPYYSPVVIERPVAPQVYIQQAPVQASAPDNYWYYCNAARAYYPYVKDCPGGWQRVAPQPAQ